MNKYQKALKWVKSIHDVIGQEEYYQDLGLRFGQGLHESIETIKELVDKETPMKPIKTKWEYACGKCMNVIHVENEIHCEVYCDNCSQKIDWSDRSE